MKHRHLRMIAIMLVAALVGLVGTVRLRAGSITGSAHDLSAGGYGAGNPCRYCHTPHGALPDTPLWNHQLSQAVYTIYQSSSLEANVGQPTGSSKLCLSCHDGTVALADVLNGGAGVSTRIEPGGANLGTDLSDDHPVSFVYSGSLAAQDTQLRAPQGLGAMLRLDPGGELQCTTCHDPHDNTYGDFLVMSNARSQMCVSCHNLRGWATSSHESSSTPTAAAEDAYLRESRFGTVAENGCLSCHRPHGAGGHERLLHFENDEENCLNCHNGSVARTDLRPALNAVSGHDVRRYRGIHDIREAARTAPEHVQCVDCHNPHAAQAQTRQPPLAPGALRGVAGVTISGSETEQVSFVYELCFKCHGDNPNRGAATVTRQIAQTNTRLEFEPTGPSYHPVVAKGRNDDVPSLVLPLTTNARIGCTSCHDTDDPTGPRGPHGSRYRPLLAYNYETADNTTESYFAYELCYQCHRQNSILGNDSFAGHKKHLEENIPCSACHDPHGISAAQGSVTGNTHLVNFDVGIVRADPQTGRLEFEDQGRFRGRCYLSCHGRDHSPETYPEDDF